MLPATHTLTRALVGTEVGKSSAMSFPPSLKPSDKTADFQPSKRSLKTFVKLFERS